MENLALDEGTIEWFILALRGNTAFNELLVFPLSIYHRGCVSMACQYEFSLRRCFSSGPNLEWILFATGEAFTSMFLLMPDKRVCLTFNAVSSV